MTKFKSSEQDPSRLFKYTFRAIKSTHAILFSLILFRIVNELNLIQILHLLLFLVVTFHFGKISLWALNLRVTNRSQRFFLEIVFGFAWISLLFTALPIPEKRTIYALGIFSAIFLVIQLKNLSMQWGRHLRQYNFFDKHISPVKLSADILFFLTVLTWQSWNPVSPEDDWRYQTDIAFLDSLASSVALNRAAFTHFSPNDEVQYHWISYSFIGTGSLFANLPPFIMAQWVFPLLVFVSLRSLFSEFKIDKLQIGASPKDLVFLILVAGPGFELGSFLVLQSPSMLASIPVTISLLIIFYNIVRNNAFTIQKLFAFIFLFFILIGVKGSSALIALLVLVSYLVIKLRGKDLDRKNTLALILASVMGFISGYLYFISDRNSFPLNIGISLNSLSMLPTCILLYIGLIKTLELKYVSRESLLVSHLFVASGTFLGTITKHVSGNEIWFIYIGFTIGIVNLLLNASIDDSRVIRFQISKKVKLLVFTLAIIQIFAWKLMENELGLLGRIGRSITEGMVSACLIAGLLFTSRKALSLITTYLLKYAVVVIISTSTLLIVANVFLGPIYSDSKSNFGYGISNSKLENSVTKDYFKAGDWVRNNVSSTSLFITNRLCNNARYEPPDCFDVWAMASALTKRNFFFEAPGYVYKTFGLNSDPILYSKADLIGLDFILAPNLESLNLVLDKGIDLIWLDKNSDFSPQIYNFTETVFESQDVDILRIKR